MKENLYLDLLKKYCDALISLQDKSSDPPFKGGIYCRACKMIHGRCPDAVYGFTVMAKISGEKMYADAAKAVFEYGNNLLCKDGAMYNDAQANWRFTTTFHTVAVVAMLRTGKDIFDSETIKSFEQRLIGMAEWLYNNLDEHSAANINYCTTNGLALALAGNYLGVDKYLQRAKSLVNYALEHTSPNGLLYGECQPHGAKSKKGCNAVDIGYNVEESIPAIVKYAFEVNDEEIKEKAYALVKAHLNFMLPDGAWDNSFGVRNNKWTYWGSRTSDGCAPMLLLFADRNPQFAEAALRNTELLMRCSLDGLLYGGLDYQKHGEHACTHHAFEHVNALAYVLEHIDEKYLVPERTSIPADYAEAKKYYEEIRTYKLACGEFLATITDNDFNVPFSGHATGGTLTALYSKTKGPMVMASVTKYKLVEPTNMQQTLDIEHHRSLTPRFVLQRGNIAYASSNYAQAEMNEKQDDDCLTICVKTGLADENCNALSDLFPEIEYSLDENGCKISAKMPEGVTFVLPLINGEINVEHGNIVHREEIFFLTGGFIADEYVLGPDENGTVEILIH